MGRDIILFLLLIFVYLHLQMQISSIRNVLRSFVDTTKTFMNKIGDILDETIQRRKTDDKE